MHDQGWREVKVAEREGWTIKVFQEGNQFIAECSSPEGDTLCSPRWARLSDAYSHGCNLVDQAIRDAAVRAHDTFVKQFVLMLLYLTGGDVYSYGKFRGRESWINYDRDVLDMLENERLLEQPQKRTVTYISLTTEGIRVARQLLQNVDLPGVNEFLASWEKHDRLLAERDELSSLDDP